MLVLFDGQKVEGGKKVLSQIVQKQQDRGISNTTRELVLRRKLYPKPDAGDAGAGKSKSKRRGSAAKSAETAPTKFLLSLPPEALPIDTAEKDKKTGAVKGEKMLPFALDKLSLIHI